MSKNSFALLFIGLISLTACHIEYQAPPYGWDIASPIAYDQDLSAYENGYQLGALNVSPSSGGYLEFQISREPNKGSITRFDSLTGDFEYQPNPGTIGTDSFEFFATEAGVPTNYGLVTIHIQPSNGLPTAVNITLNAYTDVITDSHLLGMDPDQDRLTFQLVSVPRMGKLADFDSNTGDYSYQPDAGARGTDSFTYQVSDGRSSSSVATVQIRLIVH